MSERRFKVLAVATHAVQYMAPLFRRMATEPQLNLSTMTGGRLKQRWCIAMPRAKIWARRPISRSFYSAQKLQPWKRPMDLLQSVRPGCPGRSDTCVRW